MRIGRETMRWTPSGITTNAVVFGDPPPEPKPTPEPPTPEPTEPTGDDN